MKKIAIVTSEGGMSCAYSVGVILALVEKFNLTKPFLVVGSSGSTGTLAYYVAGQYASIRNIWENLLPTKRFISLLRLKKVMDIDYLIDEVFKKQDILDVQKIKSSGIKFFISATDLETGDVKYFGNQSDEDIFEVLRASSAAIIVYNKSIKINEREYVDGAIAAPLRINIKKAKNEGADVVIAIDNSNQGRIIEKFMKLHSIFKNKLFRAQLQRYLEESKYKNKDKQVLIIKPSIKLPISTLDNQREHIIRTIQIGYSDTVAKCDLIKKLLAD